jgi:hypothetical protein
MEVTAREPDFKGPPGATDRQETIVDRVKSLILLARSRLRLALLLEVLATGLLAAVAVLALLVIAVKLVPGVLVPDAAIYGAAAAACLIAAVIAWMMRARSAATDAQVALLLDERLKLDERLTSALAFESSTDVYARAAIADAATVASDGGIRPKVRAAVPVRVPNRGLAGAAVLGVLACVQAFVPAYQWPVEEAAPALDAESLAKYAGVLPAASVREELDRRAELTRIPVSLDVVEPVTMGFYELGKTFGAIDWVKANNAFQRAAIEIARFMRDYDLLLSPTLGNPPLKLGVLGPSPENFQAFYDAIMPYTAFTSLANQTGQPSMSVPLGMSAAGLPLGSMFLARYGDEALLFRLAAQLEEAAPWAGRFPKL